MTHEEIIIRPDGTKYEIIVVLHREGFKLIVSRKKKNYNGWVNCSESELTKEEIYAAKMSLWEQMKPEP